MAWFLLGDAFCFIFNTIRTRHIQKSFYCLVPGTWYYLLQHHFRSITMQLSAHYGIPDAPTGQRASVSNV